MTWRGFLPFLVYDTMFSSYDLEEGSLWRNQDGRQRHCNGRWVIWLSTSVDWNQVGSNDCQLEVKSRQVVRMESSEFNSICWKVVLWYLKFYIDFDCMLNSVVCVVRQQHICIFFFLKKAVIIKSTQMFIFVYLEFEFWGFIVLGEGWVYFSN